MSQVDNYVFLDDFTPEAIQRPEVLELASKVETRVDPELDPIGVGPAVVKIETYDGKRFSKHLANPLGTPPANPFTMEDVIKKFRKCSAFSAVPLSPENIDELIKVVCSLEESHDVAVVSKLLSRP